jgi:AraC family transcriptional regulator
MCTAMTAPIVEVLHTSTNIRVHEYHCRAHRGSPAFTEMHGDFTLALVKKGSFGYRTEGRRHELVAGALMFGATGREYVCSHEHASGDVCLSFAFSRALLDDLAGAKIEDVWRVGALPPHEQIMVLGARDGAFDELALELAGRVIELICDRPLTSPHKEPLHVDRRRAVRAAEMIEARYAEKLDLETLAQDAGLSAFHFLRLFSKVLGVSPHQYLLRTRLAAAARILLDDPDRSITDVAYDVGFGDVSSFVRTFHRAAGVSPKNYRGRRDRSKIFQEERRGR